MIFHWIMNVIIAVMTVIFFVEGYYWEGLFGVAVVVLRIVLRYYKKSRMRG